MTGVTSAVLSSSGTTVSLSRVGLLREHPKIISYSNLKGRPLIPFGHENSHRLDFSLSWDLRIILTLSQGCPKHPRTLEDFPLNIFSLLSKRSQQRKWLVIDLNLLDLQRRLIPRRSTRSLARRICLFWGLWISNTPFGVIISTFTLVTPPCILKNLAKAFEWIITFRNFLFCWSALRFDYGDFIRTT